MIPPISLKSMPLQAPYQIAIWSLSHKIPPLPEPFLGSSKFQGYLWHIPTADILELAPFEQIPDALVWIQFGGIPR
jgi:hypothetical protein